MMVTYSQLEAEPWWSREIITQAMTGVGLMLRGAYGAGAGSFGTKGNNLHLRGGHRSQEWIKNSIYVDPPGSTYTVQSGLTTYQARFIGAFDFTPASWGTADNRAKVIAITNRLDAAYLAGRLNGIVRQFFGSKDGKTVFGRDVSTGRIISADSSHLEHVHVGVNRARADDNEALATVARIMIGEDPTMTTPPMWTEEYTPGWFVQAMAELAPTIKIPAQPATRVDGGYTGYTTTNALAEILRKIDSQVASNGSRLSAIEAALGRLTTAIEALDTGGPYAGPTQQEIVAWTKQATKEALTEGTGTVA